MDGLGRVLGVGNYVEIGGESCLMRPLTLGMLAICENHLLCQRSNPVEIVQKAAAEVEVTPEFQRLAQRALEDVKRDRAWRCISWDEMFAWLNCLEGVAFTAWLCLRGNCSLAGSPRQLREHFTVHNDEMVEFVRRRDVCSGIDNLAALDWIQPHPFPDREHKLPPRRTPWRKIIHQIAYNVFRMPHEVAELTIYNFKILTSEEDDPILGGTRSISPQDARAMQAMSKEERIAHLEQLRSSNGE